MKVDNCTEDQRHSCPRGFVKPMQLDMDENGSQGTLRRRMSGSRVSTKSKAPSPPVPLKSLDGAGLSQRHSVAGYSLMDMDQKENLLDEDLTLVVVLPGGVERTSSVHGSMPMLDLLVMLCAKYHLNPSGHTIELVTTNRNHIKFKPNAQIGTLDVERILLKAKGTDDKNKKTGPQMPESTVRLVINYRKTQKTILRVNPRVPLEDLLPAICEKCEFEQLSTDLLRDAQSDDPLDLTCTLNHYAIREVYARDTKAMYSTDMPFSPSSSTPANLLFYSDTVPRSKDKIQKEKENKGLFSLFRRSKKKSEQGRTASAPASPVTTSKPRPHSMSSFSGHSSTFNCSSMQFDTPKKRRAPLPPMQRSVSCSEPETQTDYDQMAGLRRSYESSLKRTKRKAPPPPSFPGVLVNNEASPGGDGQPPNTLAEIVEQEETTAPAVLVSMSDGYGDDSSLNLSADICEDSKRIEGVSPTINAPDAKMETSTPSESSGTAGEDQSCDLSSDGKPARNTLNRADCPNLELRVGIDSSEPAEVDIPCKAVEIGVQTCLLSEDPITQKRVRYKNSTASSPTISPPPPSQWGRTESQQSNQPRLHLSGGEQPVATSTPCPPSEDAQVQTDLPQSCLVSLPKPQQMPLHAEAFTSGPVGQKKDMATSTELMPADQIDNTVSPASVVPQSQKAAQSGPAPPKPSNELTRDYIPKMGMTTYTIVPQKTLEKLRYFEVALTLESPLVATGKEVEIGSFLPKDCSSQVTAEPKPLQSFVPGEYPKCQQINSTTTTTATNTTTATSESTVNGNMSEAVHSSLTPTNLPARDVKIPAPPSGDSMAEVKEIKIPPATKPKPGSFRMPQHKRTPGYYVTSAAVKGLSTSPGAGPREAPGSLVTATGAAGAAQVLKPVEEGCFPPPPPPVQWDSETSEGADVVRIEHRPEGRGIGRGQSPGSSPSRAPLSPGLSLEKLRSFAAPKPYLSTTPSRFAQAVSSAVRRSQSLSSGSTPSSPLSPTFHPITNRFSLNETKGPHEATDREANNSLDLRAGGNLNGGPARDNMTAQMAGHNDSPGHMLRKHSAADTESDVLPLSVFSGPSKEE
ncbi:hypothetical protein DPEC_G00046810 [Dallia pectoralis]|uniref:Uncharacterized protein n=1 Tax=Dallia pectoralis TaxID=75939 RepID=A0ACC2HAC3_DALPE|nr:hypothetical protein DPEC_G00046810 [Dallia pectoralis]